MVTDEPKKQVWIIRYREHILTALGLLFALSVAAVTGWASWGHTVHVGISAGEPSAVVLPVAIDGLMMTGTVMAAVDRFRGFTTRPWAVVALWTGSILTLAFNMASAWERGLFAMLIAVLYAVALLVTVETMFHPSRTPLNAIEQRRLSRRGKTAEKTQSEVPVAEPVVAAVIPEAPKAKPESKPSTGGRPGRRPGPQRRPEKRRVQTRLAGGVAGDQPVRPAEVTLFTEPAETIPPAMGESLADLVGGGESVRIGQEEVVS